MASVAVLGARGDGPHRSARLKRRPRPEFAELAGVQSRLVSLFAPRIGCQSQRVRGIAKFFLVESGQVTGDERGVARTDFAPQLNDDQTRLRSRVVDAFHAAGFSPPDVAALSADTGAAEAELRAILDLAAHAGDLVHLGGGLYVHADTERALRERVIGMLADADGLTMSSIRDTLGTSRKYALPMCEYLDRIGVTKRVEDRRVLK